MNYKQILLNVEEEYHVGSLQEKFLEQGKEYPWKRQIHEICKWIDQIHTVQGCHSLTSFIMKRHGWRLWIQTLGDEGWFQTIIDSIKIRRTALIQTLKSEK